MVAAALGALLTVAGVIALVARESGGSRLTRPPSGRGAAGSGGRRAFQSVACS